MSADVERLRVRFGHDMCSELYMLSDDPDSTNWVVMLVGDRPGSGEPRREVQRQNGTTLGFVGFPASEWVQGPLSAWDVDELPHRACHVEITDSKGRSELKTWSLGFGGKPCGHSPTITP